MRIIRIIKYPFKHWHLSILFMFFCACLYFYPQIKMEMNGIKKGLDAPIEEQDNPVPVQVIHDIVSLAIDYVPNNNYNQAINKINQVFHFSDEWANLAKITYMAEHHDPDMSKGDEIIYSFGCNRCKANGGNHKSYYPPTLSIAEGALWKAQQDGESIDCGAFQINLNAHAELFGDDPKKCLNMDYSIRAFYEVMQEKRQYHLVKGTKLENDLVTLCADYQSRTPGATRQARERRCAQALSYLNSSGFEKGAVWFPKIIVALINGGVAVKETVIDVTDLMDGVWDGQD